MKSNKRVVLLLAVLILAAGCALACRAYVRSHTAGQVIRGLEASVSRYERIDLPFSHLGGEGYSPLWWKYSGHLAVSTINFSSVSFLIPNPEKISASQDSLYLKYISLSPEVADAIRSVNTYFKHSGFFFMSDQSNTPEQPLALNSDYSTAWYNPLSGIRCRFDITDPEEGIGSATIFTAMIFCADRDAYRAAYRAQAPVLKIAGEQDSDDFPEQRPHFFVLSIESPKSCLLNPDIQQVGVWDVLSNNSFGALVQKINGVWSVAASGSECDSAN